MTTFTERERKAFRLAEGKTLAQIREEGGILRGMRSHRGVTRKEDANRILFKIAVYCLEKSLNVENNLSSRNGRLPADVQLTARELLDVLSLAQTFRERCLHDLSEEMVEDLHEACNLTDAGNSERLVRYFGDRIKYCTEMKSWFVWTGKRWERDDKLQIEGFAVQTARNIYQEASEVEDPERRQLIAKWAMRSESLATRTAMVRGAQHIVATSANAFDTHPNLFNCLNGTLDLETGEFREHRKEDLLTKMSNVEYDPDATCPMWFDHLETIFQGDAELIDSFQMLMGYSLLQRNPEQIMSIWYGTGKNGKSETLRAIGMILGDYRVHIQAETLMQTRNVYGGQARPDILKLKGARFVTCTEPEQDAVLAEALIKSVTGDDRITARPLYSNEVVEFEPGCKIVLATNHLPQIKGTDYGIWRRIWPIPFQATIPEAKRQPEYGAKLFREEGNGIFNWMLDGLRRYRATGKLERPEAVQKAFLAYRLQSNPIGAYLEERCEIVEGERTTKTDMYAAYRDWCDDMGRKPLSSIAFSKIMKTLFQEEREGSVRYWIGIRLKQDGADDYPDTERFTFRIRTAGEEGPR